MREVGLKPPHETTGTVTALLADLRQGRREALDDLFPVVYDELRAAARRQRRRWHGDETLGTTALVHEAYLKLAGGDRVDANGRAHFLAVASRAMRQVLSNYARAKRRQKRGGGIRHLSLDELEAVAEAPFGSYEHADAVATLELALVDLEQYEARLARVVECRFLGGMSIPDTATALGMSPATVKRDWALARAWLYRRLKHHAEP
jgi:RNA polymerase sigma factor (TIGR02999 family)